MEIFMNMKNQVEAGIIIQQTMQYRIVENMQMHLVQMEQELEHGIPWFLLQDLIQILKV